MPTWISIFFNSNYFVRKGIYNGIRNQAHFMKGRMLDLGCGTKPYESLFSVEEYIGVDIKNVGHSNDVSKVDFFYDGKKLPFENDSFDSVFSTEVFTHIFEIDPVIDELFRVLKPSGYILITVPFVWHENEKPNDAVRYTSFGIAELVKRHHFKVVSVIKQGNYFTTVLQSWNAFLFHVVFPKPILIKIVLTFIFIFPINLFGLIFSSILGKNKDLFNNVILIAQK